MNNILVPIYCLIAFLLVCPHVDCEDTEPTFKYVTSYLKSGRFMTKDDIQRTSINVLKPVIFIINGLTDEDKNGESWSKDLQDAYLDKTITNVFIVDWNLTSPPEPASINRARSVGLAVADFIETIFNKTGEAYLDIHLVGISLGYEVAVSAARRLSEQHGRKINRITGLDPSYYSIVNEETVPEEVSATFVDVVQLESKRAAGSRQIENVDFFVVDVDGDCDAKGPPSCGILKEVKLFALSINSNEIKATKCDSLEHFKDGLCDKEEQVVFGENVDKHVRGRYYLKFPSQ